MTTTIATENAKNIRQAMDVIITLDATETSLGEVITITNENLISCIVSLRADLSIIDPSLPESEININAFWDEDISEILAEIPEDTPVTYQAGYEGDMSTVRHFYVSGRVTWADNVLSIHAVDAVHFLDVETFPMFIGYNWGGEYYPNIQKGGVWCLYEALKDQIRMSQIDCDAEEMSFGWGLTHSSHRDGSVVERQNRRDLIANIINIFHTDFQNSSGVISTTRNIWLRYVDAGIPTVKYKRPTSVTTINEVDCGDFRTEVEQPIRRAYLKNGSVQTSGKTATQEAGSGTLIKDSLTAFYDFNQLCCDAEIYAENENGQKYYLGFTGYDDENTVLPATVYVPAKDDLYEHYYGKFLLDNNVGDNDAACPYDSYPGHTTERFPWESFGYMTISQATWNALVSGGYVDSDAESVGLSMIGKYFFIVNRTDVKTVNAKGKDVYPEKTKWYGNVWTWATFDDPRYGGWLDYVSCGFENLFKRSNITGTFIWKGDPNLQPRDVFTLNRRDGTSETCTIESITITHEGGGTVSEIKYRKGIC